MALLVNVKSLLLLIRCAAHPQLSLEPVLSIFMLFHGGPEDQAIDTEEEAAAAESHQVCIVSSRESGSKDIQL